MSVIGAITGAAGIANSVAGAINKGTCGKKCYGFGKSLRQCREKRSADCARVKREEAANRAAAKREEEKILQSTSPARTPTAGAVPGFAAKQWAIPAAALMAIFFFFNFSQSR